MAGRARVPSTSQRGRRAERRRARRSKGLFVVLTGHIAIFVDRGAGRHKVMEWRAGDVTGVLPYSRLVSPPGDSVAQEPTEILAVPRDDLARDDSRVS